MHPAIGKGKTAVVTGGASGIGLAAATQLVAEGLKVCVADLPGDALDAATKTLVRAGAESGQVMAVATDVADAGQLRALKDQATSAFGTINVLMNNAGMQPGSSIFDAENNWQRIIDVNMWGIIRGSQIFAPDMIASGQPGLIINTGSKQGITTPPGDPAYNVSKTGVKAFTEALQHDLRNREGCQVEARLFIPGFVFTPLTANGRTEKPAGAWTPEQTVTFLFDRVEAGDFYILCPDNEVDRQTDEKRIA
ncbi:SDR family NAD(P)-dependent oxidoreductase, partial [Tropicimonas sp. IMCC6043]|uniref:SDR family NAD(P)-dependent oxidoreductase n=1 Tax=Tropicimonas sp. IMCC6043 TaxID=2510645 RepID=UPI001A930841